MHILNLSAFALLAFAPTIPAAGGFYEACNTSSITYDFIATVVVPPEDPGQFYVYRDAALNGSCPADDGTFVYSSLNLTECITNNNGNLQVGNLDTHSEAEEEGTMTNNVQIVEIEVIENRNVVYRLSGTS
ncbi:hypothetical protein B7494_g7196 [Chlorociboria aeruginascens]|nr:hypothetical protein B7494_g7196 [Chlorociboria aeruginascens]